MCTVYEGYCAILLVTRPRISESNDVKTYQHIDKKLLRYKEKVIRNYSTQKDYQMCTVEKTY